MEVKSVLQVLRHSNGGGAGNGSCTIIAFTQDNFFVKIIGFWTFVNGCTV